MANYLLLTATVTPPPNVPELARTDPAERMGDYVRAMEFYCGLIGPVFDKIVFAENSASDLQPLRRAVEATGKSHLEEFVSCYGLDYPAEYGRGYGEMKLLDFAMANADTLLKAAPSDVIWKCTGRYVLTNMPLLVRTRPPVDLYVHCRNYPYSLCELFGFSFNRRAYDEVLKGVCEAIRRDLEPGPYANEILFRRRIDQAAPSITVARRFVHTPLLNGVRGWNNSEYSRGTHPKIIVRQVLNRLVPSIWI